MKSCDFDCVIRGGSLVDGSGAAARKADVAIRDGRIVEVGEVGGRGREEIDATAMLVTPGFVDAHTHYDGQATWDQRMQPSSWHGVTTVVMGNCGVGFAPCRAADHDQLVALMEGVEDIPQPVLAAGVPWTWETYSQYLQVLEGRSFDVDVASQLPHAPLRVYVMGDRAAARDAATAADIAHMASLAREAVEAGALGFSTSRTLNHKDSAGRPTPTLTATEEELTGIALGMASAFDGRGAGVLQLVSDFTPDPLGEFAMLRRIVERSGRPLSFSLLQHHTAPDDWRLLLGALERAVDDGLPMKAQVSPRAVGILFGLGLTLNPFTLHPTFQSLKDLPPDERVARLRDAGVRRDLLCEEPLKSDKLAVNLADWSKIYLLDADNPDYEPTERDSVAARARAEARDPRAVALDHMLASDGGGLLYYPFQTYGYGSLAASHEMLAHRDTVLGLSDGGAHMGLICDGSFPTSAMTHWARDRTRGPRLPLEHMIRKQTWDTARLVGLGDRGLVAPGYRADLNVIDYRNLDLSAPQIAYDLPAGGRRLVQRAKGYVATLVAGRVTYRGGEPTGCLPGRLQKGARSLQ